MSDLHTLMFLLLVAIGAAVQTTTGFAMGLIIMGGVTALGLAEIEFTAAVVSLISLVNTVVALRHTHRSIDFRYFRYVCFGMIPLLIGGVIVLEFLSRESYTLLKMLLGVVIIVAGTMLMVKPAPWSRPSGGLAATLVGSAGGLIAGMYSAGGAPLAYFMYRQPIDIMVIRATLLSIFALSTTGRTLVVGVAGHLTAEVIIMAALAVPLVIVVTMVTGRFIRYIPDTLVRRAAFMLLILIGGSLILVGYR